MQLLSPRSARVHGGRHVAPLALAFCTLIGVLMFAAPAARCAPTANADVAPASAPVVSPAQTVIARVNGTPIMQQQLDEVVRSTGQPDTAALRAALRTRLIQRELLRQAAESAGLGASPEVAHAAQQARDNAMISAWLAQSAPAAPISDDAVRMRYNDLISDWGRYEYQARIISVPSSSELAVVQQSLHAHRPFDWVATHFSEAPNAAQGGLWPWTNLPDRPREGRTRGVPLAIAQQLVVMKVGEVAGPVQVGGSLILMRLDDRRESTPPPFDSVAGSLRAQLQAEARAQALQALIGRLQAAAHIEQ